MSRPAATPSRPGRPLAVVLGGCCVALVVATLVAAAAGHGPFLGGDLARGVAGGLAFGVLGSLVAAQRPALPLGWLMLLVGLSNALAIALESWARWSVVGGAVPGGEVAYWAASWVWVPGYLLPPTLLLLLFPEGRAPTPRWRPLVWVSAAVVAAATAAWALTPYDAQDFALPAPLAGLRSPVSAPWADTLLVLTLPVFLACVVGSVASLVVRWRRTTGPARDPLRWMLVAGLLLAVVLVVALLLESDGVSLAALAMVPVPVAIALGVLRRGLWQLDLLLHRALVYAAMTLAVVVVYAALLTAAGAVLGGVGDDLRLVALVVTAVGTAPLRDRLQLAVNRLLYGARDEPLAAIRGLSDRLDAASHPAEVLPAIAETVTRALRLPHARIDAPGGRSYSSGTPSGREEELPLVYQGRRIGTLTVAPRTGESGLGARERALLEQVARQAAVAAHAAALQEDLQRSREHLVQSREEERKRLRRDLHDDLGPALAATAMKLETIRDLVGSDPTAAARLRDSVTGVRRIVDDLRPPSLDGLGLVGALGELLDQFAGSRTALDLQVAPDTVPADGFGAAVEVAAYRIAAEAVTNAVRHGAPSRVTVSLSRDGTDLALTVRDDGTGLPDDVVAGVGIESVHTRAAEIGGSSTLTSEPGRGTVLSVRLPLEGP